MYDADLYEYDRERERHKAALSEGAYLYRLASLSHCDKEQILNGRATMHDASGGRFNGPQQVTTYCANNVLVCLAEVLFHMHRRFLNHILQSSLHEEIWAAAQQRRCLVVLKVRRIENLVYVDSEGARNDYHPRVTGTAAVFPDAVYQPWQGTNNTIRAANKLGVFYPSARHSTGLCIALFHDLTDRVVDDGYEKLNVKLQLVPEDQDPTQPPLRVVSPYRDKVHVTMGYYRFDDPAKLEQLRSRNALYPQSLPAAGMIDFVRRRYRAYPSDAVLR